MVGDNEFTSNLVDCLPSLHAISGCDAVSAFYGIGKAKWITTAEKKEEYLDAMRLLGETLTISNSLFQTIQAMICHLYGMPEETDVNKVWYKRFRKASTPEPQQLPPTQDELLQHVKRANYQSYIWKRALFVNPDIQDPDGHGWRKNDGILEVVWMENRSPSYSWLCASVEDLFAPMHVNVLILVLSVQTCVDEMENVKTLNMIHPRSLKQ